MIPPGETAIATSVVIPAFNEAERIAATVAAWQGELTSHVGRHEIVVVDDGSTDATVAIVTQLARDRSAAPDVEILLLQQFRNRGKGAAVKRGLLAARGRWRLMCDADLPTPPATLEDFLAAGTRGADVVIGSRDLPESVLEPPQPPVRRLLAAGFRGLRQRLLLPAIRDTQCGFKLFSAAAVERVLPELRATGWLFDVELLALADAFGLQIAERPVRWGDRPGSRVRWWRLLPAVVPTLLRIRARVRRLRGRRGG